MKYLIPCLLLFSLPFFSFSQCPSACDVSFSLTKNSACDSTDILIQNTSTTPLGSIASFKWDFGDGHVETGDSINNTDFWLGAGGDYKIPYTYTSNGSFDITLYVTDSTGCNDSYKIKEAAWNVVIDTEISSFFTSPWEVCFTHAPTAGASAWIWNFGDPPSGPVNTNNEEWQVCHSYSPGAYMISLRIVAGACDVMLFDTIQVEGPRAIIEVPGIRIDADERFQCHSSDTIHFTNNSIFYQNDSNPDDEDSMVMIKGQSHLLFNFNEATRTGDQTSINASHHYDNRTMGPQVLRIWDFRDPYAPQCTTSTAKGLNVGMNCNYSEDEYPVHKYMDWDSVYYHFYYKTNEEFCVVYFDDSFQTCVNRYADTTEPELHYKIFVDKVPHSYKPELWLKDTINKIQTRDEVILNLGKPNARKLERTKGDLCATDGTKFAYIQEFKMNTGTQSYFAVNYDSMADPDAFVPFNSGGVLTYPLPGSPFPFVFPTNIAGSYPDEFVKGYNPAEVGNPGDRDPFGSFTIGLIVGNGSIPAGETVPECLDTAWYHDMFRISPLDAEFSIINTGASEGYLCPGESAYFKINNENQRNVGILRWNWGDMGLGEKMIDNTYVEQFFYMQDYEGPSPTRNDSTIIYNGEDWKYNYMIRSVLDYESGLRILDTIVISIIKDWKVELVDDEKNLVQDLFHEEECYNTIPRSKFPLLLGTCIDTTGISHLFEFEFIEYRDYYGDEIFMHGNKRFRYTDSSHSDSIEVAYVLHFRDSSLRGYDTLINGTDTIFGVWKNEYMRLNIDANGDTSIQNASLPLLPNLFLLNTDGCESRGSQFLNVGFLADFRINDNFAACTDQTLFINDSIRYWQLGDWEFPQDYPIDPRNFWHDQTRYQSGLESFEFDWDKNDGQWDGERTLNPFHLYTIAGQYIITVAMRDSLGCLDTAEFMVSIGGPEAFFTLEDESVNCFYDVQFQDSSSLTDGDAGFEYYWDFGDGTNETGANPQHRYDDPGTYEIEMILLSELGCRDTFYQTVTIDDASTLENPPFWYSINDQTINTYNQGHANDLEYVWDWGDGSEDESYDAEHTYIVSTGYSICLVATDTLMGCKADSCLDITIGACNALFGYSKDTGTSFTILIHDSSSGNNLSYIWYWGDGDSSSGVQPNHNYAQSGKYLITLRVSNTNCVSYYSDSLGMDTSGNLLKKDGFRVVVGDLSSIEITDQGETFIYPNPNEGFFSIDVTSGQIQELAVLSPEGKLVNYSVWEINPHQWTIDLDGVKGTYIIIIKTDQGIFRQRVVVI